MAVPVSYGGLSKSSIGTFKLASQVTKDGDGGGTDWDPTGTLDTTKRAAPVGSKASHARLAAPAC